MLVVTDDTSHKFEQRTQGTTQQMQRRNIHIHTHTYTKACEKLRSTLIIPDRMGEKRRERQEEREGEKERKKRKLEKATGLLWHQFNYTSDLYGSGHGQ